MNKRLSNFKFVTPIIIPFLVSICNSCAAGSFVLIYTTGEEERIVFIREELNKKFPDYNIIIQELDTGALVSKIQAEGVYTDCDIIHELEITNMETILNTDNNLLYSLDEYNYDKFTDVALKPFNHKKYAPQCVTYCEIVYNKTVLEREHLPIPQTYDDLLNPKYKNQIMMPNPKTSGTGYAFYSGLVSTLGENEALSYFSELSKNVKEYARSGSGPIKSVDRGEVAIGFAMLWQSVQYCSNNSDLGHTHLNLGRPYNLYDMAIINKHETKPYVREVFDYIYDDLNKRDIEKYIPDPVYKEYAPENPEYPMTKPDEIMEINNIADPKYKQKLIDKWRW